MLAEQDTLEALKKETWATASGRDETVPILSSRLGAASGILKHAQA